MGTQDGQGSRNRRCKAGTKRKKEEDESEINEPRVGKQYQADIPPLLPKGNRPPPVDRGAKQRWAAGQLSESSLHNFLSKVYRHEKEQAMKCLYDCNYDEEAAERAILQLRRSKIRSKLQLQSLYSNETFLRVSQDRMKRYVDQCQTIRGPSKHSHWKCFHDMTKEFAPATTAQIISRYYEWKTTNSYADFKKWSLLMTMRTRQRKLRVAQVQNSEDQVPDLLGDGFYDLHHNYCDVCGEVGGSVTCCDGCERSYHSNCISETSEDQDEKYWYCPPCQQTLDRHVRERESMAVPGFVEYELVDMPDLKDPVFEDEAKQHDQWSSDSPEPEPVFQEIAKSGVSVPTVDTTINNDNIHAQASTSPRPEALHRRRSRKQSTPRRDANT